MFLFSVCAVRENNKGRDKSLDSFADLGTVLSLFTLAVTSSEISSLAQDTACCQWGFSYNRVPVGP